MIVREHSVTPRALIYLLLCLILIIVAGFRAVGLDRDSVNYQNLINFAQQFNEIPTTDIMAMAVIWLSLNLFSDPVRAFFVIFAILGVAFKAIGIRYLCRRPLIGLVVYVLTIFILHEMTQVRAGVAAGIFLISLSYLRSGKNILFFALVAFASLFHLSAIVGLLAFFLRGKRISKIILISGPIAGIVLSFFPTSNGVVSIAGYLPGILTEKLFVHHTLLTEGVNADINLLSPYHASLLIMFVVIVCLSPSAILVSDAIILKVLSLSLFFFYGLSDMPVVAFRISEFLGVVSIVFLSNSSHFFKSEAVYLFLMVVWCFAYFVTVGLSENLNLT